MTPPNLTAPPATGPSPDAIPDFATLAADPEIAPLLSFEPVVRKVRRPDGWTDELQRELIARLAATGTVQAAVWQMGKHSTGAEALYKTPTATSFRASWDAAVIIGRRRNGLDSRPPYAGPVPGITRRGASAGPAAMAAPDDDREEESAEEKFRMVEHLFVKWLGKVEQEREARLNGDVVAADLYLRQLTFFEVAFDLVAEGIGMDAFTLMSQFRRGGLSIVEIAATPFSQLLDEKRRELWAKMEEPKRPEYPPARYLVSKPGFFTQSGHQALSKEQKELPPRDQEHALKRLWAEEAEKQLAWERSQIGPNAI
ncbi:hypothetical protein LZ496_07710 [Sphingomonas sp. NSE70-1]|uniref:Uncharacterized protein n=1 Tax=Sphingomonas caseinilyticus TaxID=2908205 RepID=A0ABT0RV38_9SPHN|nr:hypothetical protein [Sphingomonas caseinilyticus]MCL6698671.1 hypothetical protein [Sphingomonas caseinilyticus]